MTENSFKEGLALLNLFTEIYKKEEEKLPYHINLIDELHASENAHSRILEKLLQQKTPDNKFEILESFLSFISEKYPDKDFSKIKIKKPQITQEKSRIDLWVRDEDYAIIFENKIHWAGDQENQIARYINTTKKENYKETQIFVIYLPPTYDKDPDRQSWGKYEDTFKSRYLKLSFREDILSWLKETVLPNVRMKEKFLSSALEQYIDHLEGPKMFNLKNNKMNIALQEFIKKELQLNSFPLQEAIKKLNEKKEEFQELINQFNLLIDSSKLELATNYFYECKEKLDKDFPQQSLHNIRIEDKSANTPALGVLFKYNDKDFSVSLAYNNNDGYYYGIGTWYTDEDKVYPEIQTLVQEILDELNLRDKNDEWYGNWYVNDNNFSTEGIYDKFKYLLKRVIEVTD
jgi:hypothetical protein